MIVIEYAGTEYNAWEFEEGYYIPDLNILIPKIAA